LCSVHVSDNASTGRWLLWSVWWISLSAACSSKSSLSTRLIASHTVHTLGSLCFVLLQWKSISLLLCMWWVELWQLGFQKAKLVESVLVFAVCTPALPVGGPLMLINERSTEGNKFFTAQLLLKLVNEEKIEGKKRLQMGQSKCSWIECWIKTTCIIIIWPRACASQGNTFIAIQKFCL